MKHLKIIGLAMVAAAALMAFAGSASAATLTSPKGVNYNGELSSTATESLLLQAGFANITCTESTVAGNITTNNEEHAAGAISTLTFGKENKCGSATVDVITKGSLTIKKIEEEVEGKKVKVNAVTGTGSEVTVETLGTSCVYGTSTGTRLGNLSDSGETGQTASLQINASLKKISGGFACANPAKWSGKYTVTNPDALYVD